MWEFRWMAFLSLLFAFEKILHIVLRNIVQFRFFFRIAKRFIHRFGHRPKAGAWILLSIFNSICTVYCIQCNLNILLKIWPKFFHKNAAKNLAHPYFWNLGSNFQKRIESETSFSEISSQSSKKTVIIHLQLINNLPKCIWQFITADTVGSRWHWEFFLYTLYNNLTNVNLYLQIVTHIKSSPNL